MSHDHQEIVIIKRHHGDHDDHHGGVWKIAFADFMTAMMAFFLVMWLIAANDKTRATVARYFNPVKLVDATVRPPGMHDPKENDATVPKTPEMDIKGRSKDVGHKQPEGPPPSESPVGREARLDATLRTNPFVALAEIVGPQGASDVPQKDVPRATPPVIGRQGGSAFRDPFAPPPQAATTAEADPSDDSDNPLDILTPPPARPIPAAPTPAAPTSTAPVAAPTKLDPPKPDAAAPKAAANAQADAVAMAAAAKTEQRDRELAKSLADTAKADGQGIDGPDIKVKRTDEGLLVSLTDTSDFSMFSSGSAVPGRPVVLMMEKVAKLLSGRKGSVVIRGYTDNKPFKTGHYDNWALSIDRAQSAHYMLVRGGFPDARIASVEGLADRAVPTGLDPASPRNRRIEILLRDQTK